MTESSLSDDLIFKIDGDKRKLAKLKQQVKDGETLITEKLQNATKLTKEAKNLEKSANKPENIDQKSSLLLKSANKKATASSEKLMADNMQESVNKMKAEINALENEIINSSVPTTPIGNKSPPQTRNKSSSQKSQQKPIQKQKETPKIEPEDENFDVKAAQVRVAILKQRIPDEQKELDEAKREETENNNLVKQNKLKLNDNPSENMKFLYNNNINRCTKKAQEAHNKINHLQSDIEAKQQELDDLEQKIMKKLNLTTPLNAELTPKSKTRVRVGVLIDKNKNMI